MSSWSYTALLNHTSAHIPCICWAGLGVTQAEPIVYSNTVTLAIPGIQMHLTGRKRRGGSEFQQFTSHQSGSRDLPAQICNSKLEKLFSFSFLPVAKGEKRIFSYSLKIHNTSFLYTTTQVGVTCHYIFMIPLFSCCAIAFPIFFSISC